MLIIPATVYVAGCSATRTIPDSPPPTSPILTVTEIVEGDQYTYQAKETRTFVLRDKTLVNREFTGTLRLTRTQATDAEDQIVEAAAVSGTFSDGAVVGGLTQMWLTQSQDDGSIRLEAKQTNQTITRPTPTPSPVVSPTPAPTPTPSPLPPATGILFLLTGEETAGAKTMVRERVPGNAAVGSPFLLGPGQWPDLETSSSVSPSPSPSPTVSRDLSARIVFAPRPDGTTETIQFQRAVIGLETVTVGKARYRAYVVSEARTVTLTGGDGGARVVSVATGTYRFLPQLRAAVAHEESYTLYDPDTASPVATGTLSLSLTETNVKMP